MSQTYLQDAIMAFKRLHPDIRISQFTIEPENADRELNQNDFDFLLIPKYLERPDFIQEVLYEDRFALALNTSHPLAEQTEVRLADLKDESFISLPKGYAFRDFTDQICLSAGFTPGVAMECFHCQMLDLISAGLPQKMPLQPHGEGAAPGRAAGHPPHAGQLQKGPLHDKGGPGVSGIFA